jgi:8-oxo-dGTP pyrophosphatase MutT (NUDIX family)
MTKTVEKVTAFVTRPAETGQELLLFEHPNAGIQIPAGTVEELETPEEAVLREVREETGLWPLAIRRYLGCEEHRLPEGERIVAGPTKVYARPDVTSFDWAHLRRGIRVTAGRRASGFSQITYQEFDRVPDPQYISMSITGWVPDSKLADMTKRHFFHLEHPGSSKARWTVFADNHNFALFWAPLSDLPKIISPQDQWLSFLQQDANLPPAEGSTER